MKKVEVFCQENGLDINKVMLIIVGHGGNVLPQKGFTGYWAEITDTSVVCICDTLQAKKEIPFSDFKAAEFAIHNGYLWLHCNINGEFLAFTCSRKNWKSPVAKLLLQKISEHTELSNMKDYERYTGKLFWIYMWK